jgi:hypothetical protein
MKPSLPSHNALDHVDHIICVWRSLRIPVNGIHEGAVRYDIASIEQLGSNNGVQGKAHEFDAPRRSVSFAGIDAISAKAASETAACGRSLALGDDDNDLWLATHSYYPIGIDRTIVLSDISIGFPTEGCARTVNDHRMLM